MRSQTFLPPVVVLTGIALLTLSAAAAEPKQKPDNVLPDSGRTIRQIGPSQDRPDRKRTPKPQIRTDLGAIRPCPKYFNRTNASSTNYDCVFRFTPRCGPGEEVRLDYSKRVDMRLSSTPNSVIAEYYCLKRQSGGSARSSRTGRFPLRPREVQRKPAQAIKSKPHLKPGMSALGCASHFDRWQDTVVATCRFSFALTCARGKTPFYAGSLRSAPRQWLKKERRGDDFVISYNCHDK